MLMIYAPAQIIKEKALKYLDAFSWLHYVDMIRNYYLEKEETLA